MSCSPFDIREYVFGELEAAQAKAVESHARTCPMCAGELERFRATEMALLSLHDEEMPRRIAFVSDAVVEPRFWQAPWWSNSAPRLGFASAAMIAASILVHALYQPQAAPPSPAAPLAVRQEVDPVVLQEHVRKAVAEALGGLEAEQQVRLAKAIKHVEERYAIARQEDLLNLEASFNLYSQKQKRRYVSMMQQGGELQSGDIQ